MALWALGLTALAPLVAWATPLRLAGAATPRAEASDLEAAAEAAETLREMVGLFDAGTVASSFSFTINARQGSILVGDPEDDLESVGACLLHKVGIMVYADAHLHRLSQLQVDLASCCTFDREGCVDDSEDAYSTLGQVARAADKAEAHRAAARASALLVRAAGKRVRPERLKEHHKRFLDHCMEGPLDNCTLSELGGKARRGPGEL